MKELAETLTRIQTYLKATKGQYNAFGKYKYRSCENILESLKPHLKEEEAFLILEDNIVQLGDRFYVQAKATLHKGEAKISTTAYAREADSKKGMDSAQVTGATSSYARKYALNGLFAIDDSKDSDTMPPPKSSPELDAIRGALKNHAEKHGNDASMAILKSLGVNKAVDLPDGSLDKVLKLIEEVK